MDIQPDQFIGLITSFGATGVLAMWLRWALNRVDKLEQLLERKEQEIKDALKDCNRESDTRRLPVIPEPEKERYRARMNMGDE